MNLADFALGDRLHLYSDGVTEAMNEREEDFGTAGLLEPLARTQGWPIGETVRANRKVVTAWRGCEELDDDLALTSTRALPDDARRLQPGATH